MGKIIVDSYKISIADFYIKKNDNLIMKSDVKYPEFSKRLSTAWKACDRAPIKQTPLAKWLGFSQPTVNDWLNGKGLPSMDTALKICDKLGCSVEWLLTGKDGMAIKEPDIDPFYTIYAALSEQNKIIVQQLVQALSQAPENTQKTSNNPLTEFTENVGGGEE